MTSRTRVTRAATTLLGVTALTAVLLATRWGIGLSPDSMAYVEAARHLSAGRGLAISGPKAELEPMTHWPPLYPASLATLAQLGLDPLVGARWFGAFVFGLNVTLVGCAVRRRTPWSPWPALFAALLVLTSVDMLFVHAMAWSEGLFITLGGGSLYYVAVCCSTLQWRSVFVAGLLLSFAFLTRYVGLALVVASVLAVLVLPAAPVARRASRATALGAIGVLPIAAWLLRNRLVTGAAADLAPSFHPASARHYAEGVMTASRWLLPQQIPAVLRVVALLLVLAGLVFVWRRRRPMHVGLTSPTAHPALWIHVLACAVVVYVLMLAVFISFVSVDIAFDARYLAPAYVGVVVLITTVLAELHCELDARSSRLCSVVVASCIAFGALQVARGVRFVRAAHRDGLGYATPAWQTSPTLATVRGLPADVHLYSNAPRVVTFFTGRPAVGVPAKFDSHTGDANPGFARDLALFTALGAPSRRLLVYLRAEKRAYAPSEDELREALPLREYVHTPDGSVYEIGLPLRRKQSSTDVPD